MFLDLANGFGSVPDSLIWKAFDYFRVPVVVVNLIRAGFPGYYTVPKYSRFHNRLAEARNRHYGKVYDFSISIYNGDGDHY